MSALTIISRVFGLVREQVRGFYLGTGMESDAFGIAATIPNMLRRLFAEGAMTAAFVPVFTQLAGDEDRERLSKFFSGFMTLFILLMIGVTLVGIAFAEPLVKLVFSSGFSGVPGKLDLTVGLTRMMFPYIFFVSVAAIIQGTLNSFRIFGPSAFTPVLLSAVNIATVVFFNSYFPNPAWAFAVGFLLGGVFQMAFQIPFLRGKGLSFRATFAGLRDPAVKKVALIFLPGIFSAGIYQINVFVSQIIAAGLDSGSVASLQFSLRLQELVLGIFAVSVATVMLPTLSEQVHRKEFDDVKETLLYSINLLGFVTIPAMAGLALLGTPIVRMLFEYGRFDAESTRMTVYALYFHTAGIFFIAMQRNVVQVFYAMEDLKTPTMIAAIVMVLHIALCYLLAVPLKHGGVAAAGSIGAVVNVALLVWVLRKRIGRMGLTQTVNSLSRIIAATAIMSIPLILANEYGHFQTSRGLDLVWRVLATVIVASAVFIGSAWALKVKELRHFLELASSWVGRLKKKS